MSFSVGIVGLPNVGKSTLFKALTKKPVDIAAYPFTTIHPNVGVVTVPDERLENLAQIIRPEKITPTIIEFVDVAGLVKGAHKGEGLGNQFLAQIRNCDAILEVVRAFSASEVEHVTGEIQPEKDIEIIKVELLMKDLETLENLISKLEKESKDKDKKTIKKIEFLKKIKDWVSQERSISEFSLGEEEKEEIKEYQFLTQKPIIYLLNTNGKTAHPSLPSGHLEVNLKEEEEISELSDSEAKELGIKPHLDQLIFNCYNILDLITFYTVAGGKETRAWTLKRGQKAPAAGGIVHSDFEEKFIRAEVISWQELVKSHSPEQQRSQRGEPLFHPSLRLGWEKKKIDFLRPWKEARELGLVKTIGRDYVVQDGDVIEFKI